MQRPSPDSLRPVRYVINGLLATAVHFAVLAACIELLRIPSAGLSNVLAASVGISVSFLGSRYYVFEAADRPILGQAVRFGALYAAIAALHGLILFGWTDVMRLDYRIGFLVATLLQMLLSYVGNQRLVFRG